MKILIIHTKYLQSLGGEDTTVDAEAELLQSKGNEVRVYFFDNAQMAQGTFGKFKAGLSSVYNYSSAQTINDEINQFMPDIVHVHNFFFAASPSVLSTASKLKVPVVVTLHNFRLICTNALLLRNNQVCELCVNLDFPWYGVKYKCYHGSSMQSAMVGGMAAIHKWMGTWKSKVDLYITPSAFSRNKLINSSLKPEPGKIKVKHNFIKDPGTGEISQRKNHFLFVGRLSAEKGVQVLLEAWKELPSYELMVAGDGPDQERLVAEYGLLSNVTFLGKKQRHEVIKQMKLCRALVFPSIWYEGLPMTIVESFATGTPVIASNLGAMAEMITDGYNGLLLDVGNANAIRDAVKRFNQLILEDNHLMYHQARQTYLTSYHPDKCYEVTMQLYNELIKEKNNADK